MESDVMRSLYDLDLCIVCKYQKVLYRDYVEQLHIHDGKVIENDKEICKHINQVVTDFINEKINFESLDEV